MEQLGSNPYRSLLTGLNLSTLVNHSENQSKFTWKSTYRGRQSLIIMGFEFFDNYPENDVYCSSIRHVIFHCRIVRDHFRRRNACWSYSATRHPLHTAFAAWHVPWSFRLSRPISSFHNYAQRKSNDSNISESFYQLSDKSAPLDIIVTQCRTIRYIRTTSKTI